MAASAWPHWASRTAATEPCVHFLLLSIRAEKEAADNEYESFLRFTGLDEADLPVVNLVDTELPPIVLG